MLKEVGIVVAAWGDKARVKTERKEACAHCQAKGACEVLGGGNEMVAEVLNPVGAREGQAVEIIFESRPFLVATFMLYMVPALALLAGVLVGQRLAPRFGLGAEPGSILGALILTVLAVVFAWRIGRRLQKKQGFRPTIGRILAPGQYGGPGDSSC